MQGRKYRMTCNFAPFSGGDLHPLYQVVELVTGDWKDHDMWHLPFTTQVTAARSIVKALN